MDIINYKKYVDSLKTKDQLEREWRDLQLKETDYIILISDYPNHAEYITYRQELRDYPAQADFPNGDRPVKP